MAVPDLAVVQAVAPEVVEVIPASECPCTMWTYLQRSAHSRPRSGIHLAVYETENADESVASLGWEWAFILWNEGSTWTTPDGVVGGDVMLMDAPSAMSWKLIWSELSGRLIATAYADECDVLTTWWGQGRTVVIGTYE